MASSHRGLLCAVFAILPVLLVVGLMFPESIAFAGSSILEIEPPLHAESAGTSAQALNDDDEDDDDDANATPNHATADGANASQNDGDDTDSAGSQPQEGVAESKRNSDRAQKDLDSADPHDADDDSDDADDDSDDDAARVSAKEKQPGLETRFDHETDSDRNDVVRTSTIANALLGDSLVSLRRDVVAAHDPLGSERVEGSVISIHKDLSETFALGGGFGSYRTNLYNDFAGSLEAHWNFADWSISASVARDLLVKSAQSIRSNIRQTDFGLSASYDLTKHLSSDFEFHHKLYSDGNSSNDLTFSPVYEFALEKSQLDLGYSFNYQSFALAANHGYYDPRRLISNGLTGTWKFDRDGYYGNFEASEGYADIKGASGGLGAATSAMCTSVVATLGLRPAKDTSVEGYWSGERSAVWSSSALGLRIRYNF